MHVVVLGGGYAGLTLARLLESDLPDGAELTLVDRTPDHLVQHELHRVIRRPELADAITVSLPAVLERTAVRVATVTEIDRENRVVSLSSGDLAYDVAAICLGARTAYHGLEGVREHAIPLKRLRHANRIRKRVRELCRSDREQPRIVVGGAGLSGIQVAGELAELVREEESRETEITLLEQRESVAPSFPPNFQRAVRETLEAQGIEVRTRATVSKATDEHVVLESGETVPYDEFVWTGGIRGPDLLAGERPAVESDLRLDDRTFVLGDAARVVDAEEEFVPASAQSAVREARTVATNVTRVVERELEGESSEDVAFESFTFDSPGWLVSVGDDAVAQVGPAVVTGRAAKTLKSTVGLGYLSSVGATGTALQRVRGEFDSY
ncbi:NAD(P)/FAD-dependent oxidoreductase [Natronobacterium gregoryi]|uniref:FAD-dependent pyridine nucleotide-disulfide oxidoreductase n=2 Tax=Natronobacterium gregoryi TaxID=44930 RepID=L0ADH3_NATGS|nr:FAD-dependent oxidoreductase [Natronobacterium gregoryi]AFZ71963.1 NADH dehydrogenase, FAD-containing subunit [Natronobacterium gregoryi SP2]ELY62540.1 FAD-dependent pyridine nucleotide-disulfide oxidoreductase [Natronobacterium gregoryi SP2]PLK20738.1 NADH dehydrogenase FAD-containing subunit [Natronobacterium gregoryi SP2]SFJ12488.1 NADH dehydrogenase [Natronobacterium gregoryi]